MTSEAGQRSEQDEKKEKTVLPEWMSGGPHGVGDPNDRRLRRMEKDVLINKIVRERTQKEKCNEVFMNFLECSKRSGFWVFYKCRTERDVMNECLGKWYNDEDFKKECTEQYLQRRKEYRETGVKKPFRQKERAV